MTSDAIDARLIARILRVNDAGERGGVAMYRLQLAIARHRCPEVTTFLTWTRDHEADHAARFRALMPSRGAKVCRLPVVWRVGAVLLGGATALMGRRAVLFCTECIEASVHRHLGEQLAYVRGRDPELAALIESVQADEQAHLDEAVRQRAGRPVLAAAVLEPLIRWFTEALMWLSTRGDVSRLTRDLALR